jgi:hypothetical protein
LTCSGYEIINSCPQNWRYIVRKIIMFSSILLIVIVIFIFFFWLSQLEPHWSADISDTNPRKISTSKEVVGIKDTYEIAKKRVDEWREGTYLHNIMVNYIGKDQIQERKGLIRYFFYIKNNDSRGLPHVNAIVDIDTERQEIIRFEAFSGFDLGSRRMQIDEWELDIIQAMDIAEKHLGTSYFSQYPNPMVRIRANYDNTIGVGYHPDEKSYTAKMYIKINMITGEVEHIQQ